MDEREETGVPFISEAASVTAFLPGYSWSFSPHLCFPPGVSLSFTNPSTPPIPSRPCLRSFKRITYTKGAFQSAAGVVG